MGLVTPNTGELELLNKMLKAELAADEDYILKLFTNNFTIDANTVTGDFVEANFTGYVQKVLYRGNWSDPDTNGSGKAFVEYAEQSWNVGVSGNTVYGYYVLGANSNICLWAEKFASPRTLSDGDELLLTPVFTLNSENATS